jgi:vitamin B12 transporter
MCIQKYVRCTFLKAFYSLIIVGHSLNTIVAADDTDQVQVKKFDEVVVTANRIPYPADQIGSSVIVINSQDIAKNQNKNVVDVLRSVPGLNVVATGSQGGSASVFIRGANSEHTLVLIDGVEANNPVSNSRSFNFANLTTANIERIEILKGPQSALYGSETLGGVIQIFTKKGEGVLQGEATLEGGGYGEAIETAGIRGSIQKFNYSLGASRKDVQGFSAASNQLGNSERDGFQNTGLSTRLGYLFSENAEASYTMRYDDSRSEIDNCGGAGCDDPNRIFNLWTLFTRGQLDFHLFDKTVHPRLGVNWSKTVYTDNNNVDSLHPLDTLYSNYEGNILKSDLIVPYQISDYLTFLSGAETEVESGNSTFNSQSSFGPFNSVFNEISATTNSLFSDIQIANFRDFSTSIGGRIDSHSKFGTYETWRGTSSYQFRPTKTRFKGSVSTGFKAPSLYQLYSEYGTLDLNPEKSFGWDVGFEQEITSKVRTGVTFYQNNLKNLINFEASTFKFFNVDRAKIYGIESYIQFDLCEAAKLNFDYTLTNTENLTTKEELLRRPKNRGIIALETFPLNDLRFVVQTIITSRSNDNDFSEAVPKTVTLGGYTLVNLTADYKLSRTLSLTGRVDNLFDKEYQVVNGYGTAGITGYGGVKFTF